MTKITKLLTLALTLFLLLSLATPAMAATITLPDNKHTYEVYQIFTGVMSEGTLTQIKWGQNGTGYVQGQEASVDESVLKALAQVNVVDKSDSEKLTVIDDYVNLKSAPYKEVSGDSSRTLKEVPTGYYLIKDKDGSLNGQHESYTLYVAQVVDETVIINEKSVKPTVDKQVHDETGDAEAGHQNGWGESADHSINESFQFKLIANLPESEHYNDYTDYKIVFTDTMSDGVTFESIHSVTVDGVKVSEGKEKTNYQCSATAGQAGGSWTLTIENVKDLAGVDLTNGATVEVIYNAHLNENAEVFGANAEDTDNKNGVYLQYSNNPNVDGEGDLGKTTEDYVWLFTYVVENTKLDQSNNNKPLTSAGFKLYSNEECTREIKLYKNSDGYYYPVASSTAVGVEMFPNSTDGKFYIRGLDAGDYYLKETTVPQTYNPMTPNPLTITIRATHIEDEAGASAGVTLTDDSTVQNTIFNKKGTILPSTGGIGTTIFYILGSVLALGAVVLLVTKKRMGSER